MITEPVHAISEPRRFAGGISIRIVRAGWFRPDAGGFFGVVPKPLWSRFVETDERGRILCRLNLLLVEADGKRILIETGTGVRMTEKDRDIKGVEGGDPAAALRAVGEDPATIDFVVLTHLHYDHAGGMVDASSRPLFPNARYVVQRDEAEAAHGDELRVQGIMEVDQLDAVRSAGQLAEVNGEVELVTGVRVIRTGGHTRGSQAVLIGVDRPGGRAGDPTDRADLLGRSHPDPVADPGPLDECLRRLSDRRDRGAQRARRARCRRGLVVLLHARPRRATDPDRDDREGRLPRRRMSRLLHRVMLAAIPAVSVVACATSVPTPSAPPPSPRIDCGSIAGPTCDEVAEAAGHMTSGTVFIVEVLPVPTDGGMVMEERYLVTVEGPDAGAAGLVEVVRFVGAENWSVRRLEARPSG